MSPVDPSTEALLTEAARGDAEARNRLFGKHRRRLCGVVAVRLHPGVGARVDPSDVVQESLADADGRLADYLRRRPLPFYLWLRQLTLERLADVHRRHVRAQKRSVRREARIPDLPEGSWEDLAATLAARGSSPSKRADREEARGRVRAALGRLAARDREVLVLRHLEQLSTREIAVLLGLTESAVKVRHMRALQRLQQALGDRPDEP
jgi:RNA polymerase sigma-70 factor (ECF subfamily)